MRKIIVLMILSLAVSAEALPVTLTVNGRTLNASLNDSVPARSLAEQLPLSVRLYDSDNDFCGGNINIKYTADDVRYGYKNGDLAFWTPANNFVIFVSGEENSSGTGDLVILGRIDEPREVLDELSGTLDVTIALSE